MLEYNLKYGEVDLGNGTFIRGQYAPEVYARDVTNSMNSGLGGSNQAALPAPAKYLTLPEPTLTNKGALPNPYSNSGLLTYTPAPAPRTNYVFINDGTAGGTVINQVGLNELKPTYFPPTPGVIYNQHPYYGFYPATDISTLNNTSIFKEGALPHICKSNNKSTDRITKRQSFRIPFKYNNWDTNN